MSLNYKLTHNIEALKTLQVKDRIELQVSYWTVTGDMNPAWNHAKMEAVAVEVRWQRSEGVNVTLYFLLSFSP